MAESWEEMFRELDADRALLGQNLEDRLARRIVEKIDADVLSALGVPADVLWTPPPCDPFARDEPVVIGTVYWAFGKACPWYVDNDPELQGRVAIETTGRVLDLALLQLRAEPS